MNKRQKTILSTIRMGLAVIAKEQLSDGSFVSLSSFDFADFSGSVEYRTTFFTANILACLNTVAPTFFDRGAMGDSDFGVAEKLSLEFSSVRKKAAGFLMAQKSEFWSFNYWALDSRERETIPYPDDLDDTFVALAALHGYDPTLIDGAVLAHTAKLLIATEVVPGGPYRTWLFGNDSPPEWRDVDIAVNANVGYFLSRFDIALPNLEQFIDKRRQEKDLHSPYYPSIYQPIYFLSRFYSGEWMVRCVEAWNSGEYLPQNLLEIAMKISVMINGGDVGAAVDSLVDAFINAIEREGFRPYAFCIDPSRDGKKSYAGAAALTAAFCVEALAKYLAVSEPVQAPSYSGMADKQLMPNRPVGEARPDRQNVLDTPRHTLPARPDEILLSRTKMVAQARFGTLSEHLKQLVLGEIEKIENKEIVMVPYLFNHALGEAGDSPAKLLEELALANLYGWIAYTIYDDFLDGEGDSLLLSVANFFLRELTLQYATIDKEIPGLADFYRKIMDGIDDANIREQLFCRVELRDGMLAIPLELPYRSLDDLADRSLGHALPAIALLLGRGCAPDSREINAVLSFFKNYLTARQLHDDAHDWQEDLRRGQINSVGVQILKQWRFERGDFADRDNAAGKVGQDNKTANGIGDTGDEADGIDLAKDIPALQKLFWHSVILDIIGEIKNFLEKARNELGKLVIVKNPEPLEALLESLESSADRTLREREQAVKFLEAYR